MANLKARPCDEGSIRATRGSASCTATQKRWVLAATILGSTISFIDESVVNVALPAIEKNLAASAASAQWIVNAYTLALSALLLLGGAGGDRFGRRRIFVTGTVIFALASLWCGIAPGIAQLLAARVTQGIGAALLVPCSLAIIGATFEESERGKAIGTWAAFSAVAAAVGPLAGGFITDHTTWRVIFLINPLLAIPTILVTLRHVPESRDAEVHGHLDWLGAALALLGLGSAVFGIIALPELGWRSPLVLGGLAAGFILLAAFVWVEARSQAPMMPLGLFRSRTFSGVNLLTLLLYAGLGGALFFLPFALIQVEGTSATVAGTVFLPFTIIMGALSRWSGGLLDRFGARGPLIIGPLIVAAGFGLLALTPGASLLTRFFIPISVMGFGMTVSVAPLTTMVINAVPTRQAGVASGINNAVASVANLLAVAIFGAVVLTSFDRALDRSVAATPLPPQAREMIERGRGKFVIETAGEGEAQKIATSVLKDSLAEGISTAMLLAAGLAVAGAAAAALTIEQNKRRGR
ncbi:MAG TPA: MFS transporter [Pseudolabrys sp.]|nr:MFS transporter [Pseudolabrys sp.]